MNIGGSNLRDQGGPFYMTITIGKGENDWFSESTQQKIKDIVNDLPTVDQNRRYIMGGSRGGIGDYKFIANDPDFFAAAVIICGRTVTNTDASKIVTVHTNSGGELFVQLARTDC